MENLQNVIATLENATLKLSGEKLNQTQRNEYKATLQKALVEDLAKLGVEATLTTDGVVLMIENATTNLYVSLEATIKNLDYDLDGAKQEFAEKVEARLERERLIVERREKLAKEKSLKQKR
jgi:ribosome-associated translation inhibitor RaiA